jgi:pimeloyl-ACP methyl ester carboxylesterase
MTLPPNAWIWLFLVPPAAFVVLTAASVTAGVLYGAWVKRGEVMDADQARLFGGVRASPLRRVWGLVVEIGYQMIALCLRALHDLKMLPPSRCRDASCTPVLVLPGYTENCGTMWWLGRRLARAGFYPMLIDFPSTLHRIEDNVEFLRLTIAALRSKLGLPAIPVVAHSMGGLITRTLVHTHADHGVLTLIAIASPFRGTHLARIGRSLGLRGHCLGQMVPGSDFLQRYPPTLRCEVPILSLMAFQENIVVPEWSAVVADAEVRVLSRPWGHQAPLFVGEVYTQIERWLLHHGVTQHRFHCEQQQDDDHRRQVEPAGAFGPEHRANRRVQRFRDLVRQATRKLVLWHHPAQHRVEDDEPLQTRDNQQ